MTERTAPPRPMRATYRLQLTPGFGFADAAERVPSLARLGISHLYLSPVLAAAKGSTHGYDVIDHSTISEALGGEAGFHALVQRAHASGLGLILDIVPNHMSIGDRGNRWWWEVLQHGPSARSAAAFDVDWNAPDQRMKNTVLLPVLGDHQSKVLARGELRLNRQGSQFVIAYADHRFPVAPRSWVQIWRGAARRKPDDR